jgi:membrane-bound lytic murein transglycosylase A
LAAAAELSPHLERIAFSDIEGWPDDDHAAALHAFRAGGDAKAALPKTRSLGVQGEELFRLVQLAGSVDQGRTAARDFFECCFVPHRVAADGFVTGYYEPEAAASRTRTSRFGVPLYRRPPDLVDIRDANRPSGWDQEIRFGRATGRGVEPFPDRAAIEAGALAGPGLELAWIEDPVEAFFIHVQGSARLRLQDGSVMRIAFDGKSGHAYTSIGRLAVQRGLLRQEDAGKSGLEAWLKRNREAGRALMAENRSFIFFREVDLPEHAGPLGAAGVPLTPGRSLAVDRTLHTFHTPIWVDVEELADPDRLAAKFRRLMIAQDTGSAIVGGARGDLFFGSGEEAGIQAGRVRNRASMVALVPAAGR